MCDIKSDFKLCTCSGAIDKSKPHWRLYRSAEKNAEKKNTEIKVGMLMHQVLYSINKDTILYGLRSETSCFDFDYKPQYKDLLVIKLGKESFYFFYDGQSEFEFDGAGWKFDGFPRGKWSISKAEKLNKGLIQ